MGEYPDDIDVEFTHFQSSVEIQFKAILSALKNLESWGIRDFFLYVKPCSDMCATCTGFSDT